MFALVKRPFACKKPEPVLHRRRVFGGDAAVIQADSQIEAETANHPRAIGMGLIAGISHNLVIGCLFGSFTVMLASAESRLHVSAAQSSAGGLLILFGSALTAAIVGSLAARFSLRLLMFMGAGLSLIGYLILAFTSSYALYLASFFFLFGPSLALAGSIGPATLVTRWFSRNRGLALGLVHLSIVIAIMPLASNWMLEHHGATATYLMLAGLVGVILLPTTLLIRDHPPGTVPIEAGGISQPARVPAEGRTVAELVRIPQFWALALGTAATMTATITISLLMMPLATSMGVDRTHGAWLSTTMSVSGMVGSVLFGWVADRIGGIRGLALLAFDVAILWALLLLDLPFWGLAAVIGLLGMHGAGMVPNISRAMADSFGAASFSRAFGLASTLSLPFQIIAIFGSSAVYSRTGSYTPAMIVMIAFLLMTVPIALSARRKNPIPA
jgi:MFS family permease